MGSFSIWHLLIVLVVVLVLFGGRGKISQIMGDFAKGINAFKKGLKEGKWMIWFINGKVNEITFWKKGMKNGKYTMYNGEGRIMVETKFKNDKLNGTMTSYQDGKILSKRKYKNGIEVIPKPELPMAKKEDRKSVV